MSKVVSKYISPHLSINLCDLGVIKRNYILKAKSNFTLFSIEYIFTRSDFKQKEFCH